MFEFWFHGLDDGDGTFTHHGTTYDYIQILCDIAEAYSPKIAGEFVTAQLEEQKKLLPFLRVVEWNFKYKINDTQSIELRKVV